MAAILVVNCLMGSAFAGHAQHASWTQLEELWHAEYKAVEHLKAVIQPVAELGDVLKTLVYCPLTVLSIFSDLDVKH